MDIKLYLALAENLSPHQARMFTEVDGKFVDLNLAYAAYLMKIKGNKTSAYEIGAFYLPGNIAIFLDRGESALKALKELNVYMRQSGVREIRGPAGEKATYEPHELRILPPLQTSEKTIVIGFSDQARLEAIPKPEIPTGFYKLPSTIVTSGAPITWPSFSQEVDCDACLAVVIGKSCRRIEPEHAWEYVAGVTMLLDITARDINKREGLTTNNLLGKNFPSSTSVGPALALTNSKNDVESLEIDLAVDGIVKQSFKAKECVFAVEQIIAHWSILGLRAGDLLAIGASMSIRGDQLQNPVPLTVGSRVCCSSGAIGRLSHQVVSSGGPRR